MAATDKKTTTITEKLAGAIPVSRATIDRMPLYYRALRLAQEEKRGILSSEELGRRLGITPEQIRKDLAAFGQFGKKGVGYDTSALKQNIGKILGLEKHYKIAVVGIGHLGAALANYQNFTALGFCIAALFDQDPAVIGNIVAGLCVDDMKNLAPIVRERGIDIGIIAVPAASAQETANALVAAGVRGIWNFAPTRLCLRGTACLESEDLSVGLSRLSYRIAHAETT